MFKVYVLISKSHGTRYIGYTEHLNKRVAEHNKGKCKYTKTRIPWDLIYFEEYESRAEAMNREKFLKSGQGRKFLDDKLK